MLFFVDGRRSAKKNVHRLRWHTGYVQSSSSPAAPRFAVNTLSVEDEVYVVSKLCSWVGLLVDCSKNPRIFDLLPRSVLVDLLDSNGEPDEMGQVFECLAVVEKVRLWIDNVPKSQSRTR